jgi:hypothetical protein
MAERVENYAVDSPQFGTGGVLRRRGVVWVWTLEFVGWQMIGTIIVSGVVAWLVFDYRKTKAEVKAMKARPVVMGAAPVGGIFDGLIDNQVNPQLEKRLSPEQIEKGLSILIAFATAHRMEWAAKISDAALTTLIPQEK